MLRKTLSIAALGLFACSTQAQTAPPSNLRFEAASIKPSNGFGECVSRDPGWFKCKASLKNMIFLAFRVPAYQVAAPVFKNTMYDQVFETVASVPKEAAKNWGVPPKGNSDEVGAMLRNLLIDRFKLAYHYEQREVQGYSLTVDRANFKPKGDPSSKPIGAPKDYVPPAGSVSPRWHYPAENWVDVTRATMGRFAEGLSRSVFKGIPITDDTGLKDAYTFSLHFESPDYMPTATAEASEPLPTIFQALARQGLKLKPKKVMADFVVIDHVEKSPTGN